MKKNEASSHGLVNGLQGNNDSSVSYLHTIIDSLQDELLVVDKEFHILEANQAFMARVGKSRDEIIGQFCYNLPTEFSDPCLVPLDECPLQTVWQTGKPARLTHVRTHEAGKGRMFVDVVASPIHDKAGATVAVAILMRDVTEIKELELKIAEAQEDLSALNTIASVVAKTLDLDTVLSSALDTVLEIMQRSTGGIMLLDEDKDMLTYRVYRGLSDRFASKIKLKPGEGIAGSVIQTRHTVLVDDILKDESVAHLDLLQGEGIKSFAAVPLYSKERTLGVLNIMSHESGRISASNVQFLESIAAQIAIAIENARLHQEVQEKEEIRGELLRDIFSIQEEERRRIARELHDETSQVLASLSGNLEAAASMLPASEMKTKAILRKAQSLSIEALDETHKLIYELRPTLLDDLGLIAATRWLIDNNLKPAGVKTSFKTVGTVRRLQPEIETTLFRVTQEALNNIARHSSARQADIRLQFKRDLVILRVKDNGNGFDVDEAIRSKERPRGLGLLGMMERVELIRGKINIISNPDNRGTEVNIEIPLKQEGKVEQNKNSRR